VTEHTLDLAKETAQTCMEQQIAYSSFDEKQKQVMNENLHEWADKVMQGFKKRLRESGRLIES
jgi:arsenate reductase-like glutaredoxin family protein